MGTAKAPKRIKVSRDKGGTHYTIPEDGAEFPEVHAWWSRGARKKTKGRTTMPEYFVLKQENGEQRADVILLTPGQLYDLIEAANLAVELP